MKKLILLTIVLFSFNANAVIFIQPKKTELPKHSQVVIEDRRAVQPINLESKKQEVEQDKSLNFVYRNWLFIFLIFFPFLFVFYQVLRFS